MYWESGGARRVFAAVDNFIYALNPTTGKPIATFGSGGRIDLRENLGRAAARRACVSPPRSSSTGTSSLSAGASAKRCLPRLATSAPTTCARACDVGVPHDSASWRGRLRDVGEPRGPYNGGANNWPGMALDERTVMVTARPDRRRRTSTARIDRRQPFRQLPARARRGDAARCAGTSSTPPRSAGSRPALAAEPGDGHARRPTDRRGRAGDQAGLRLPLQSRQRQPAVPDQICAVSVEHGAGRVHQQRTTVAAAASTVRAAAAHRRPADHTDAGRACLGRRAVQSHAQRRPVSLPSRSTSRPSSFPATTAAPNTADRPSIQTPGSTT